VPSKTKARPSFQGRKEDNRAKAKGVLGAMRRKLVWIENERFLGWGCSECAWVFHASGTPIGKSLEDMMKNYELQRDNSFAAHVCAEHPRAKDIKG
jgi:hypothetical protein